MAKQNGPVVGQPSLSPEKAILRLEQRIADLAALDPRSITQRFSPEVKALETAIAETLEKAFGVNSPALGRYSTATHLDSGPLSMTGPARLDEVRRYIAEGKEKAITLLQQAIKSIKENIEDNDGRTQPSAASSPTASEDFSRVFIVHGRTEGPKETVARFLDKLHLKPVILHEQASQSRTIIEKLEAYGKVQFAVVLLTPEDIGHFIGEAPRARARQNVILELGYFVGHLGRSKVCALAIGDVEIPSDWQGVINEKFDDGGAWKMVLARELKQAGFAIDWNKVME